MMLKQFPETLEEEKIHQLFAEYAKTKDKKIREQLITANLKLVAYIAYKFTNDPSKLEDIFSEGCIGLIKAVDTFDLDKKIKFSTYASNCIYNQIGMYYKRIQKGSRYQMIYLNESIINPDDSSETQRIEMLESDEMTVEEKMIEQEEYETMKKVLRERFTRQKERTQKIIVLKFNNGYGQIEISQKLGISQSYVSRIIREFQKELQNYLMKEWAI